jgi:hypothetical protein
MDGRVLYHLEMRTGGSLLLGSLSRKRDEETLLHTMGIEAANVHLGSRPQIKRVLADLHRRKAKWLRVPAKAMADATELYRKPPSR